MKNNMNNRTKSVSFTAGLIVTALLTGCSHSTAPKTIQGKDFAADDQPTSLGKLAMAQSAAGAKEDGMLYDLNFHGGELNSLGEGKLNLIAKGTCAGDAVYVFLNMPHDQVAQRQAAVTAYLKAAGVKEEKIIVAEGPNPNLCTPTAYNLNGIYKQDGTSYTGQGVAASAQSGPMGGGGR